MRRGVEGKWRFFTVATSATAPVAANAIMLFATAWNWRHVMSAKQKRTSFVVSLSTFGLAQSLE